MNTATTILGAFFCLFIFLCCYKSVEDEATGTPDERHTSDKDASDLDGGVTDSEEEQTSKRDNSQFSVRDDGTVVDKSVGLTWMRCPVGLSGEDCDQGTLTTVDGNSNDALPVCEKANVAGYDDWRLPDVSELVLLVDYERVAPSIDEKVFPGTPVESFLATLKSRSGFAFVSFYLDEVNHHYGYALRAVRCVRGEPITKGPLTMVETDQETVLWDEATDLIWMSCPADYEFTASTSPLSDSEGWPETSCQYLGGSEGIVEYYEGRVYDYWEARDFCSNTDYGGFDDWRLPTASEVLQAVLDNQKRSNRLPSS